MVIDNLSGDFLAAQKGAYEPQRKYNFLLEVGLDFPSDAELLQLSLGDGALPQESNDEIELPWVNEYRYVAGKTRFQQSTWRFKDYVDKNTASVISRWRQTVYDPERGSVGLARNYKRIGSVRMFAPDGSSERVWEYKGLWPQSVNYGDLSMGDNDIVMIEVTFRYDKAVPLVGVLGPLGLAVSVQGSLGV